MTTALLKASALILMPSDSSGDIVTTTARAVEVSGAPDFSDSFETIERSVVRQAFSTYAPLRGLETTSASINLELHGSGQYDQAPESSLLFKSIFGVLAGPVTGETWEKVDTVLSTTTTAAVAAGTAGDYTAVAATSPVIYTLDLAVTSTTGFQVGFPVRMHDAGTISTIGFVTAVTDSTHLAIITENPAAVDSGDIVDCGYLYLLRNVDETQVLATPESNVDYHRGNIVKERWTGLAGTSFDIDFSTGQVCLPAFTFEGAEVGYSDSGDGYSGYAAGDYTGINTTFDSANTSPLVVQLADVFMYNQTSSTYFQECISNVQISISNEVFKKQCIATLGIGEVIRTSRAVTGSLNTFYTGKDFQEAFKADTQYSLRAIFNYAASLDASGDKVFNTAAGNIVAISCPQIKFSDVSVSEDTGIFKYDSAFSAEPNEGDDELILAFL